MTRVLIADDNIQITEVLKAYALKENMQIDVAYDGEQAWTYFINEKYDILLLDVMMPKLDGFSLCKRVREKSMVPIILITAKGEDYDRIMGLDLGADDYIVKPFAPAEVMARIRAILRRVEKNGEGESERVRLGSLTMDTESYTVQVREEMVSLTKKEFELLWILAKHPGKVFTRDNLLDSLWGFDYYGDPRTVDTHIKRIRAKIPEGEGSDWKIQTIRGVGYRLDVIDENGELSS